jgi:hypothetical protein
LGLSKGTKLAALLREMEQVSSKLALLGQKARLSRDSNAKELAKAQATLLRETLKDIINECRRLRDQNVQSPSPQKQQQQQQQQVHFIESVFLLTSVCFRCRSRAVLGLLASSPSRPPDSRCGREKNTCPAERAR